MSDVMSISAAALHADQARLESISRNAANAATPGYRRAVVASVDFDQLLNHGAPTAAASGVPLQLGLPLLRQGTDPTQGGLTLTGRPLDLAIEGRGHFVVAHEQGLALTRAGTFKVDAEGWLIDGRGRKVQGRQGDVRIGQGHNALIDAKGAITVDGVLLDVLMLKDVPSGVSLLSGDGLTFVSSSGEYVDAEPGAASIRSGFLESSNTSNVQESIGMVETVRHYESVIRLMQGHDELLGKTIQKLGEF